MITKGLNNNFIKGLIYYIFLFICSVLWGMGQYPVFFYLRFFCLIPFLYILFYRKHYLVETLIFGWIAYLINFYWLYITIHESGKLSLFFALGVPALLCFYYGLQYPIIAFLTKKITGFKKCLIYFFPVIFAAVDFLFPKLFRHTIGDSQINFFYFVQLIDVTGMTGLILIIMSINVGLYLLIKKIFDKSKIKASDFIFILPLILVLIYGTFRINYLESIKTKLPTPYASMIQGNISGKQKLDEKYFELNIKNYNDLTMQAVEKYKPDFLIWPESVFNRAYNGKEDSLKRFILHKYPPLILGVSLWETYKDNSFRISNSAYLVKDQKTFERYDKQKLLAFGEYVPFEKKLPFLRYLTPFNYNMTPGTTSSIIRIGDNVKASMSICFEDIFPDDIRKKVNEGSNLMINITNDSWYGEGLGPLHHSVLARLRSIENRRSFYRCTPTGLTTANDFTGRILAQGQNVARRNYFSKSTVI